MPFNCNPCGCPDDHARHEPTWRKAVLTTICAVIEAVGNIATSVFHVIVDSLPAVDVASLPTLNVATLPNVTLNSDTAVTSGRKTSTTPGTAVTLVGAPTSCKRVDVKAINTNTGIVTVGGSGTLATPAGSTAGIELKASEGYSFSIDDAQKIYMDAAVSGEGVTFNYFA